MKNILLILLFASTSSFAQFGGDTTFHRTDTTFGYLITQIDTGSYELRPIYRIEFLASVPMPCSMVYVWKDWKMKKKGKKWGVYVHSEPGFYAAWETEYKGDTLIEKCESSLYGCFREEYFIPCREDRAKLGEKYEMKKSDYFETELEWYPDPIRIVTW